MTLDFRCDKCGKMLKLEAEPGAKVRCSNCRAWTKVPALFGQLPRPHVPASAEAVAIPVKHETEEENPVALSTIGASMPWVFSAMLHVGVFLVMLFIMIIGTPTTPQKAVTGTIIDYSPPPPMGSFKNPDGGSSQSAAPAWRPVNSHPPREFDIAAGPSDKEVVLENPLNGHGKSVKGRDLFDGNAPGGGLFGHKGPPIAGAPMNIVYVVDRSGSMVKTFEGVKLEMIRSISRLASGQKFHIVLFGDGKTIQGPRRGLVASGIENKLAAAAFLQEQIPEGSTTALVALKRAFTVLAAAPADESKLIYLVSDGDFSGLAGGSQYRTADGRTLAGNEAVLQWLVDENAGPKVYIQTVLLHSTDETAVEVLKAIARQNGGRFKYISPDE